MKITEEILEIIEKYLKSELNDQELRDFTEKLKNNPELANEVEEFRLIYSILDRKSKKQALKQKLDSIHNEMDAENSIFSLKYYQKRRNSIYHYIKIAGVAAAAAVVATFTFLNLSGIVNKINHVEKYNELKKDIAKISKNQNSLWKEMFSNEAKNEVSYSGTCFAITTDGYLITSFHLVNNLDSVIVSQSIDSVVSYNAKVIAYDKNLDLALLKITDEKFNQFNTIPYSFSKTQVELGEEVFTLGYSKNDIVFGEGSLRSVTGFNSDTLAYEISIPVQPGNSGAPLIDSKGRLIGIINGRDESNSGSAYAVKSSYLETFIKQFNENNKEINLIIPRHNTLKELKKVQQIKKLQPIILRLNTY